MSGVPPRPIKVPLISLLMGRSTARVGRPRREARGETRQAERTAGREGGAWLSGLVGRIHSGGDLRDSALLPRASPSSPRPRRRDARAGAIVAAASLSSRRVAEPRASARRGPPRWARRDAISSARAGGPPASAGPGSARGGVMPAVGRLPLNRRPALRRERRWGGGGALVD